MFQRSYTPVLILLAAAFTLFFVGLSPAKAHLKTRIVVLPFYVEQGQDAYTVFSDDGLHYRRMSGFIENHLVDTGFQVVDPFAKDGSEKEYSRLMERAREDSALACMDMAGRYAVDVVYIVWLEVTARKTLDGYWKASAVVTGKGYDSAGRSLGVSILETFKVTRRDFNQAVALVEKEVGEAVGIKLTRWRTSAEAEKFMVTRTKDPSRLKTVIQDNERYVHIRLDQANVPEITEAFGKVVNTVRGVLAARQYYHRIVPDNPQACVTEWKVEIDTDETDPFRLQANIMKMIYDILDSGGTLRLKGVPYRYSPEEIRLMNGIYPGSATSRSIQFIVDRKRMRDRETFGKHSSH